MIKRYGKDALLIEWEPEISRKVLGKIMKADKAISESRITGLEELIPAYNSITVFFNTAQISYEDICLEITAAMRQEVVIPESKIWKINVCYDEEYGVDLHRVCSHVGMTKDQVIEIHSQTEYDVHFFGFLPGFMYLGGLDASLNIGRLDSPRISVPEGSVALANGQTGIYPMESPGGWNIIGRSHFKVFNPDDDPPCRISIGDKIRFVPIEKKDFLNKTT